MNIYIPEEIKEIIKDTPYTIDEVGRSGNTILLFPETVLKIEEDNEHSQNAAYVMANGKGKLPVPELIRHLSENGKSYTLCERIPGKMSCDPYYLEHPEILMPALSEALNALWSIDITKLSLLPKITHKSVDGLLHFSHGDLCMPNIMLNGNKLSGFIDLGDAALSSKWRDLSLIYWSLTKNSDGTFGSKIYEKVKPYDLFSSVGMTFDKEAYDYWIDEVPWMNEV